MCMHANSTMRWDMAVKKGVWNEELFGPMDNNRIEYVNNALKDRSVGMLEQIKKLAPYARSIKIIGGRTSYNEKAI